MKKTTMKTGSPRKSNWSLLLWFAPLLVPMLWFGMRYYPRTIETYLQIGDSRGELLVALAAEMRLHPYTQVFKLINADMLHSSITQLAFDRHAKRLSRNVEYVSGSRIIWNRAWNNVEDRMIYAAARRFTAFKDKSNPYNAYDSEKGLSQFGATVEKKSRPN